MTAEERHYMVNGMDKFIEVTGEAEYEELPDIFLIDLDLAVRAAKEASAEKEVKELVNSTLNVLFENGLTEEEVSFGGRETYTPWWQRKKTGFESRNRLTIKSSNRELAYRALDAIDKYPKHKRISLNISERQPIFKADEKQMELALSDVVNNARKKADLLAQASGVKIQDVLIVQETSRSVRASGAYGDYDWGDASAFTAAAGDLGAEDTLELEPSSRISASTRTVTIKYRVRFSHT